MTTAAFQKLVLTYYRQHGRDLPWRRTTDPYAILVSEIMLQQTQVSRVIPKYHAFLKRFPTVEVLAASRLGEVLQAWSGLGYNRRAKYLHEAARQLPPPDWTYQDLVACKGIGANTAAAVLVYAYNQPQVFIETNIRSVYLHHFFEGQTSVPDKMLRPLIAQTLDRQHPREWYWALMDYGAHLKATAGNAGRQSRHYRRQSAFEGSRRQVRGQVIRLLTDAAQTVADLQVAIPDARLAAVVQELQAEGFIKQTGNKYRLW